METRIDTNVIEGITKMNISDDEKMGRIDAYVHEIVYNRKLKDVQSFMAAKFGQIGKALNFPQ